MDEYNSLLENNTWDLVNADKGESIVGCKWIFKWKLNSDGQPERAKARLVAQGYSQEYGVNFFDTYALVASFDTLRLLLAIAASRNIKPAQLDIKTAFLNGVVDERILVKQPPGLMMKQDVCSY